MKRTLEKLIAAILLTLVLFLACGCAGGGAVLRTERVSDTSAISGRYTLTLFNDVTYIGLKAVGFLSAEGSGFTITPYAPSYTYASTYGVSGQEALQMAVSFVQKNPSFIATEVSRILSPSGATIGYEVRPLFQEMEYGAEDVMSITYVLKGPGNVEVHIDLIDLVQEELSAQGIL